MQVSLKIIISYALVRAVVAIMKQYFIWKHTTYLIKEDKTNRVKQETKRKKLRSQLELAVVNGDEAEIERIR